MQVRGTLRAQIRGTLRALIVALVAVHVAGLLGGPVLPLSGTLVMLSLLVYVAAAPEHSTRIGFACLAVAVALVESRGGEVPSGVFGGAAGLQRTFEGGLTLAGLAAFAVGAVRRRRWRLPRRAAVRVPALLGAGLLAVGAVPLFVDWATPHPVSVLVVPYRARQAWPPAPGLSASTTVDSRAAPGRLSQDVIEVQLEGLPARPGSPQVAVARGVEVPPRDFWSLELWNARFSWADVAPAGPAMVGFGWLIRLAARRGGPDDEALMA